MLELAYQSNLFHPAEALLNALALLLADGVASVPSRAAIDGASARPRRVLRDMRRHVHVAAFGSKLAGVETLVATSRNPSVARNLLQHQQGSITLGAPVGFQQF